MSELICLRKISKSFGNVKALKSVDLSLKEGEILALVGENGAGKSTLMKILSGVYSSLEFQGEISVQGKEVHFSSPKDSEEIGIALIHQELSSFPQLTVAENMTVGHWPKIRGFVNQNKMMAESQEWLSKLDADFLPSDRMSDLSTGQQQVVEIAKALSRKSKVLILDEPTSSLTTRETKKLFIILKDLKQKGCGIIYITHRMEEIFTLADRVTVLRDGESVFTSDCNGLISSDLIRHMVGRSLDQFFPTPPLRQFSKVVLKVSNFTATNVESRKTYGPLSFSLHQGEILGFGGLLGSGRSEILQALLGDEAYETTGDILLVGSEKKVFKNLREAFARGFGFVAEDRKQQSLLPTRSLNENTGIVRLSLRPLFTAISTSEESIKTHDDLQALNTRFDDINQLITELSGGNQQKVVFARVLQNSPSIILLDEPTRGVDVGAKFEIYQLLFDWAKNKKAILMISSDLPELMAISDRIIVMAKGKISTEIEKQNFDKEKIMTAALEGPKESL